MNKDRCLTLRLPLLALVLWTFLLGGSLWWNFRLADDQAMAMAYAEARANLNKDITFRRWASMHGGVYVPITESQKSIPWLSHVSGRDVTTTSGLQLTLLNPATMLRQMMDLYAADYGIRGRITGLRYLNPGNAPDAWEKTQLEAFSRGEKNEVWAIDRVEGKPHLRYLRAMFMEPGCDKCHGILGYKTGDFRGATGLNLPLAPYLEQAWITKGQLAASHFLIWFVGLVGIIWSGYIAHRRMKERELARLDIVRHRDDLERQVAARTADLSLAKEAADEASRAKSAFLANMSHEIRTPLNAIAGLAYLVRKSGVTEQQSERLDKIEAAGGHLLEILNAVLDLSKIEAGKMQLDEGNVSIEALVRNVVSMVSEACSLKRLDLKLDLQIPHLLLVGDRTRLQQALLNYVSNAVKFTETGEISIRVSVEEEASDSLLLRFAVADTGPGIAPDVMEKLFSPFEQADNSTTRKFGGTGLGLAINAKFAALMGGQVGVESAQGQGSTFWFTARLRKGEQVEERGAVVMAFPPRPPNWQGKRILLVEDEPINREISLELLREVGLTVDCANDGVEGIEHVQANQYDLILMDMQMPRMDGLSATKEIRTMPYGRVVPILAMTANAFHEDRMKCIDIGMNDFIAKPVEPEILFAMIGRWLDHPPTA